jgi:selenocysteine lyase/cysteine desulfurase
VREEEVEKRLGVISFNVKDMPHALVGAILNYEGGIGVRNGCFCAHPYVKCLLGVTVEETKILEARILMRDRSSIPGAVRLSFGMYNTREEVDKLVDVLKLISAKKYRGTYRLLTKTGEYVPDGFKVDFADYYQI